MRNLNEPLKQTPSEGEVEQTPSVGEVKRKPSEGEVISLESRRSATVGTTQQPIGKRAIEDLRGQWTEVQASFVDEPRKSVEHAHQLVSSAIQQITESLNGKRSELEKEWSKSEASTEDLRTSLQHYRALFDRLLEL
jgi:CRISPR/Cas system-associated endonuclease Cas1